ncbi:MAG TPA: glycosyltransferase family 4 protein [Solirubrobacteraceae bacterium]|nr:glycosyltransferase family 4 protein [Solirubrobacteraceae bacterium]
MTRVQVVDPSAFTRPYDHALCTALGRTGATVELVTSRFAYGEVPPADGYTVRELFYRHAAGAPGSRLRRLSKLADHVPDMLRFRRLAADADVVHLQWLTMPPLDVHLLPDRPLVLTAHDLLPREPRPGQLRAQRRVFDQMDGIVVHSEYGRRQLVERLGVAADKVHVIHHGAFDHVAAEPRAPLPAEVGSGTDGEAVVLFTGLLRPYKGLDTLLRAWRHVAGVGGAQLWIAGRPMMPLESLRATSPPGVRWVPRFVTEGEIAALLERADIVVLPYSRTERFDQSGVLASALAFGKPAVVTDIGGFSEIAATGAARLVAPDDPEALGAALAELTGDAAARKRMAAAARAAAQGPYSWERSAHQTVALYERVRRR